MDSTSPKNIKNNKVPKKVKKYNVGKNEIKPKNNQEENKDKKENLNNNDEEDVKLEEDIPEDIDIQEDEFQRILVGGADSLDKSGKHNSKNAKETSKEKEKRNLL